MNFIVGDTVRLSFNIKSNSVFYSRKVGVIRRVYKRKSKHLDVYVTTFNNNTGWYGKHLVYCKSLLTEKTYV